MDYEMLVQKVYESILERGDIVIDAGAHVGRHTIPIAIKIAPNGKVFAYEPLPMCQKTLINLIKNEYPNLKEVISIYPYALSEYEAESEFTITVDNLGYSGLKERKYDTKTRIEKIQVAVKKLDNLLSDIEALKYIKIDAEGGEFNIIKGGTNIIKKFRPLVTFEFGASSFAEYSVIPEQVYFFWHEKNYVIYDILGNWLDNERTFAESSIKQNVWDYIAVPVENKTMTNKVLKAIKYF